MRSFFVSMPPKVRPPSKVLLYLHGVGEAFYPITGQPPPLLVPGMGAKNLFNHGIPRILEGIPRDGREPVYAPAVPPKEWVTSEPPFEGFLTIAPQTFLREDMSDLGCVNEMMEDARKIAKVLVEEKDPKIAIMGFSRGGFAAFRWLADHQNDPDFKGIVSMDAAEPESQQGTLDLAISRIKQPYWAFFTDYPQNQGRQNRITEIHSKRIAAKAVQEVPFATTGAHQCMTQLGTQGTDTEKHNDVCAQVTCSDFVYHWILKWL